LIVGRNFRPGTRIVFAMRVNIMRVCLRTSVNKSGSVMMNSGDGIATVATDSEKFLFRGSS
jgi:hypothetical protein